jgi:glycosyltransferase involved in cell wall biosynthesis
MSSAPLISIVLPTYNGCRYLHQAIESCLHQTFTDWELILVDDASTDQTPEVMREYASRDNRIRVFRNPVNSKLPKSLNNGFAQARGKFLTWTSDDNCYRPEALATMLTFLETNPNVDVVYANYTVIDENGLPKKVGPIGAGPLEELPFRNVVGACFLYRRKVHEELRGYAEDLFLVEDYDFWLRASTKFQLSFLNKDLYLYRWHPQSLSLQQPEKIRLAREQSLARNLPLMRWLKPSSRVKAWRSVIDQAITREDRFLVRRYFKNSLRGNYLMPFQLGFLVFASLYFPSSIYKLLRRRDEYRNARRLDQAVREIIRLHPATEKFILVDEEQLRSDVASAQVIPFVEKDGQWWGPPNDDDHAIQELERLRKADAAFIIFIKPTFWWLDHYVGFNEFLRAHYKCILANDWLIVFDLRQS